MSGGRTIDMGSFAAVDQTGEAARFLAFLDHVEGLAPAVALRARTYELLDVASIARAGGAVADVGCGAGRAVAELAERGVAAIGIDASARMIAAAAARFPGLDVRVGTAETLPLADRSLAGYRAERLYQHLADPAAGLAEAFRALVPGGRIVLADQDYDTWAIDAGDVGLTRAIARAHADSIAQPWMGRRHRSMLLDAGFRDVAVEVQTLAYADYADAAPVLPAISGAAVALGVVSEAQAADWLADQAGRGATDRFFFTLPVFVATATKP